MHSASIYIGLGIVGVMLLIAFVVMFASRTEDDNKSLPLGMLFLSLIVVMVVAVMSFSSQQQQDAMNKAKSDLQAVSPELEILNVSTATHSLTYKQKNTAGPECTATYSDAGDKVQIDVLSVSCKVNMPSTLAPTSTTSTSTTVDPNGRLFPPSTPSTAPKSTDQVAPVTTAAPHAA